MGPLESLNRLPPSRAPICYVPFESRLSDLPQLGIATARPCLREAEVTLRKARVMQGLAPAACSGRPPFSASANAALGKARVRWEIVISAQHPDRRPHPMADHQSWSHIDSLTRHIHSWSVRTLACMRGAGAASSASMACAASAAVGRSCGLGRRQRRTSSTAPSGHSLGTLQGNGCLVPEEIGVHAVLHGYAQPIADVRVCGMNQPMTKTV